MHATTLENLDLNLRYGGFGYYRLQLKHSDGKYLLIRGDTEPPETIEYLIGSLRHFTRLRTLAIDFLALCGNKYYGFSELPLSGMLPLALEDLTLRVPPGDVEGSVPTSNDVVRWRKEVVHLVVKSREELRPLKRIRLAAGGLLFWEQRGDGGLFAEMREAFCAVGMAFEADNDFVVCQSPLEYFKEANRARNWGIG